MKKVLYVLSVVALLSACTADLEDQTIAADSNPVNAKILNSSTNSVGGAILVYFEPSAESRLAECATRSGATRTGVSGVDAILDEVGGYSVEPLFVVTEKNREKVYAGGYHLWYELRFDNASDMELVASKLAGVGEVQRVQYVHHVKRIGNPQIVATTAAVESSDTRLGSSIPFNDTYAKYQWGLENLGPLGQVKAKNLEGLKAPSSTADINVVPAWKLSTGDPSIVVAVLDEGVLATHDDLKNNIWINSAELNGKSNYDDDGNGYKDDIYGFNFTTMQGTITCDKRGDTGHGSHVAGIIAAENNNGIGICGIAGGSGAGDGVRLMSLQIFSGVDPASTTGVARAMQYAADNGVHIMQNSWGYASGEADNRPGPSNDKSYKYQLKAEANAIDYFIENGGGDDNSPIDGGVVIFASGNDSASLPGYPGAYEPVVAVAAMNPAGYPAWYTNYGIGTDVAAPGGSSLYSNGEILSTVPSSFSATGKKNYGWMEGTSQACPHVSGVAALGLSYAKQLGKRYTANEFRSMLLAATTDLFSNLTGGIEVQFQTGGKLKVNYPEYNGQMGIGSIDAYKLLLSVDGTPCKVMAVGETVDVDLALYFGEGIANAQFVSAEAAPEEAAAMGLTISPYADGKISISASKRGAATIIVKMLVGGGSLSDTKKPFPTEVTRKFAVIAKEMPASNGGWL